MQRAVTSRIKRIDRIEQKLAQRPGGWTMVELARELGTHRATIQRDLALLKNMGTNVVRRGSRYILDKRGLLHSVRISTDELLALYLAARLLCRHTDEHNPHVVTVLEKLGAAIRETSPLIAHHIQQAAAAVQDRAIRQNYIHTLEVLTQAWAEGKKVRIRYHSYSPNQITERTFSPYFIEPQSSGYASYVFGFDDLRNEIRTFKIERIENAELIDQSYSIPENFDPQDKLSSAWGIIWSQSADVTVILRFAPAVVRRVKESTWHHTQRIEDQPDGSCLFTVRIGSTKEFMPWVRGWGADVEVLEPQTFRQEMIIEAQRMANLYLAKQSSFG